MEKLKEEAEIAENMISLTEEQVNAIQTKLNQELEMSSKKGLISSFLVSAIFFVAGLTVNPISKFLKRLMKKRNTPTTQDSKNEQLKYTDKETLQVITKTTESFKAKNED